MSPNKRSLPSVQEWQAINLRVTLFGVAASQTNVGDWWKMVTGEDPESVTRQPKLGVQILQGPFLGSTLVLSVGLNRYSWDLVCDNDLKNGMEDFPKLGPFPELRDRFLKAIEGWLPSAPPANRIAFGAGVRFPVKSKSEAFALLSALLLFELDGDNSGDFLYRINRYTVSTQAFPGMRINRLRTWQAMKLTMNAGSPGAVPTVVHEQGLCSLELDINTDSDRTEAIPADRLVQLLQELAHCGTDVIARGEQ